LPIVKITQISRLQNAEQNRDIKEANAEFENIVSYRPVAKRWFCKYEPLLGNARTQQ
jgi:hypothetical protein